MTDGSTHTHHADASAWRVGVSGADVIELGGFTPPRPSVRRPSAALPQTLTIPASITLGESHYRRSEQSWSDAGRPSAMVTLQPSSTTLDIHVRVPVSDRTFVAAGTVNPYDNEPADINGDGIELFIRTRDGKSAWVLVPDGNHVRIRDIDGWRSTLAIRASWREVGGGYEMNIVLPVIPESIDLLVNEKPLGRERRRGQLVLSGGGFAYLRGDRQEESSLLRVDVTHA
jgi:hypothetical protein